MKRVFFGVTLLALVALFPFRLFSSEAAVAVLDSGPTAENAPNPAFYAWESSGAAQTLRALGVPFAVLKDNQITTAALRPFKLLILPDSKDMSRSEAAAIEAYAKEGGKVLATGFASYRDEADQPVGLQNNFQLSELFGADYLRYNPIPPAGGGVKTDARLGGGVIPLGRNNAIQIRLHRGALALAGWVDDDGATPSFPEGLNAAIVENSSRDAIYIGENLFDPENSNSSAVRALVAKLIDILAPGTAARESRAGGFPSLPPLGPLPPMPGGKAIRVMLPYPIGDGFLTCAAPFTVYRSNRREVTHGRKNWKLEFHAQAGGFTVADRAGVDFTITPDDPRYPVELVLWHGGRAPDAPFKFIAFRGSAVFEDAGGKKYLVNAIPLEQYLPGVVSHEVPPTFHLEALKTMAVVARTFALKVAAEHKFDGYDICATVECQSYDGLSYESRKSREAVMDTLGKVVVYNGRLADLPYHATCGGVTEDIQDVWDLPAVPYLRSVVDGPNPIKENLSTEAGVTEFLEHPPESYCEASSRFRWKETYTAGELTALFRKSIPALLKRPADFHSLIGIRVTGRTPHGRVTNLDIATDGGTFHIAKDQIRWLFSGGQIGLGGLQSTLFVIQPRTGADGALQSITFLGGGWGHGVGLCQFGAEGMAQRGFTYKQILSHYFPGTRVVPASKN